MCILCKLFFYRKTRNRNSQAVNCVYMYTHRPMLRSRVVPFFMRIMCVCFLTRKIRILEHWSRQRRHGFGLVKMPWAGLCLKN